MSSPIPICTLIGTLMRIYPTISRAMSWQIGELKLSEYQVLDALTYVHGFKMRWMDLAKSTGLTPSAITKILISLEQRGLIAREADPRDARSSYVYRTFNWWWVLLESKKIMTNWWNKISNFATEDEMEQAEKLLARLADTMWHTWWYGDNNIDDIIKTSDK